MDILTRSVPFESRAIADDDGLTLEGYAAVFGEWTRIDSYEGTFDEQIARGAFAKTIAERTPVLQFDHGAHPLIGSIPLGTITKLREDDHGLFVRARLADNWLVEPVRDAITDGAITGMSFRFSVVNEKRTTDPSGIDRRTITECKLYECGPVVWPAYSGTAVGVRAQQLTDALTDPQIRAEVARFLLSTRGDEHVDLEPQTDDEPREHSSTAPGITAAAIRHYLLTSPRRG